MPIFYTTYIDGTSANDLRRAHNMYDRIYNTLWAPSGELRRALEADFRRNPDLPNTVDVATLLGLLEGLGWFEYLDAQAGEGSGQQFANDLGNLIQNNWDKIQAQLPKHITVRELIENLQTLLTHYAPRCEGPKVFPHRPAPMVFLSPYHPNLKGLKPQFRCSLYEEGDCNEAMGLKKALAMMSDAGKVFPAPLPAPLAQLVGTWAHANGKTIQYVGMDKVPPGEIVVGKIDAEVLEPEHKHEEFPGLTPEAQPIPPALPPKEVAEEILAQPDDEEEDVVANLEELAKKREDRAKNVQTPSLQSFRLPHPPKPGQYRGKDLSGETHVFGRVSEAGDLVAGLPIGLWDIEHGDVQKEDGKVVKDAKRKYVRMKRDADGIPRADIKTNLPVPTPRGLNPRSQYEWQELAIERWVNADNGWRVHKGQEYNGIVEACTGSGKTKFAVKAIDRLLRDKKDEKISITIMCPPSMEVQGQWYCELQNHGLKHEDGTPVRQFKPEEIAMFGGFLGDRDAERRLVNIYIVNTASGRKEEDEEGDEDAEPAADDIWADEEVKTVTLLDQHLHSPEMRDKKHFLICDEVHRYSPRAKKFSKIFATKPDYSLLITGTMIVGSYHKVTCEKCRHEEYFPVQDRVPPNDKTEYFMVENVKGEGRRYYCKADRLLTHPVSVEEQTYIQFYTEKTGPLLASYTYPEALWKKNIANFRIWFVQAPLTDKEALKNMAKLSIVKGEFGEQIGSALDIGQLEMLEDLQKTVSKVRVHELVRLIEFCNSRDLKAITFNREINPIKVIHRYLINEASGNPREYLGLYHTRSAGYFGENPVIGKFEIEPTWIELGQKLLRIKKITKDERLKMAQEGKQITCVICETRFAADEEICPSCNTAVDKFSEIKTYVEMPVPHVYSKLAKPVKGTTRVDGKKKLGDTQMVIQLDPTAPGSPLGIKAGRFPVSGEIEIIPSNPEDLRNLIHIRALIRVLRADLWELTANKPKNYRERAKEIREQISTLETQFKELKTEVKPETAKYEVIGDPANMTIGLYTVKDNGDIVDYHLKNDYPAGTRVRLIQTECIKDLRTAYMEEFRIPTKYKGSVRVILSGKALVEGIDVPDADIGISIGPLAKTNAIPNLQSLGRVLRPKKVVGPDGQIQPVVKDYILFYVPGQDDEAKGLFERYLRMPVEGNEEGIWVCEGGEPKDLHHSEFFSAFNRFYQGAVQESKGGEISYDGNDEVAGHGFLEDTKTDFTQAGVKAFYRVNLFIDPKEPRMGSRHYKVVQGGVDIHSLDLGTFHADDVKFMKQFNSSTKRGYSIETDFRVDHTEIDKLTLQVASPLSMNSYAFINPDGWELFQAMQKIYEQRMLKVTEEKEKGILRAKLAAAQEGDLDYGIFEEGEDGHREWRFYNEEECEAHLIQNIVASLNEARRVFRKSSEIKIGKLKLYEIHNPKVVKRVLSEPDLPWDLEQKHYCDFRKARTSEDPKEMESLLAKLNIPVIKRTCEGRLAQRQGAYAQKGRFKFTCFVNGCVPRSPRGKPQDESATLGQALDKAKVASQMFLQKREGDDKLECIVTDLDSGAIYCATQGCIHPGANSWGHLIVPGLRELAGKFIVASGIHISVHSSIKEAKKHAKDLLSMVNIMGGSECTVEIRQCDGDTIRVIGTYPGDEPASPEKPKKKERKTCPLSDEPYTLWFDIAFTQPVCDPKAKVQYGFSTYTKAAKYAKAALKAGQKIFIKGAQAPATKKRFSFWLDPEFTVQFTIKGHHPGEDDLVEALKAIGKIKKAKAETVYIKGLPVMWGDATVRSGTGRYSLWRDKDFDSLFAAGGKYPIITEDKEDAEKFANKIAAKHLDVFIYDHQTDKWTEIPKK